MVILSTIITVLLTIVAIGVRMALISAQVALKAAETSLRVANRVSDKAIRKGKKVVDKAGKKAVKEVSSVHKGAGDAASKGHKAVSAVGDVAVNTAIAAKRAAVLALRLLMKALRWVLHLLDGIVAALCAVSTVLIVVIIMVIVMIFAAFGAIVPIGAGAGDFSASTSVTVQPSSKTNPSPTRDAAAGWSTKGQVSVPHLIQNVNRISSPAEDFVYCKDYTKEYYSIAYGNSNVSGAGCGAMAFTCAISGVTGKLVEPADVVTICRSQSGGDTTCNGAGCFAALAEKYNLETKTLAWWGSDAYHDVTDEPKQGFAGLNEIKKLLDDGYVCVMSVGDGTGMLDPGAGHYICCYGYDSEGFYVSDSWYVYYAMTNDDGARQGNCWYTFDKAYPANKVFCCGIQGLFFLKKAGSSSESSAEN